MLLFHFKCKIFKNIYKFIFIKLIVLTSNNENQRNTVTNLTKDNRNFSCNTLEKQKIFKPVINSEIEKNQNIPVENEKKLDKTVARKSCLYNIFEVIFSLIKSIKIIRDYLVSDIPKSIFAKNFKTSLLKTKVNPETKNKFLLDCIDISYKKHNYDIDNFENIMTKFVDIISYLNHEYPNKSKDSDDAYITKRNCKDNQIESDNYWNNFKKRIRDFFLRFLAGQHTIINNFDNTHNRLFFNTIFRIEYFLYNVSPLFETTIRFEYGNLEIFDFHDSKLEIKKYYTEMNYILGTTEYQEKDVFQCKIFYYPEFILVSTLQKLSFFFELSSSRIELKKFEFNFYGVEYKLHAIIQYDFSYKNLKIIFFKHKEKLKISNADGEKININFLNKYLDFESKEKQLIIIIKKEL